MLHNVKLNVKTIWSSIDTLLSLLAIAIWFAIWLQGAVGLEGLLGSSKRLFNGQWFGWNPIVMGSTGLVIGSIIYWMVALIVILLSFRVLVKLFMKPKSDEIGNKIDELIAEIRADRESSDYKE
jgi:hypothetical protein